jgi:predicted transcriptional regulator with HTH domain
MRAVVDGIEIEGTPQEVAAFISAIRDQKPTRADSALLKDIENKSEYEDEDRITERFAYRTIKRIPISESQKKLLQSLKNAHPKWMRSSELQAALDWTPNQLGGVFGGLGRRLSATEGYIADYLLWDTKWDIDEGEYSYRLPDNVVTALTRAGL